jgi:RNA polymerase sigma-70 factor (ECF subfamily)
LHGRGAGVRGAGGGRPLPAGEGEEDRVSSSDRDARFEALFERYYRSVIRYLFRLGFSQEDSRDLAQTVFSRVYRGMDTYRGEAEWTFLETTARRVALNEIRRRRTQRRDGKEVSLDAEPHLSATASAAVVRGQARRDSENELIDRQGEEERRRRLYAAMASLEEPVRYALLLRLGGLKYAEIARSLRVSLDTVKARLHQARKRLQEVLREEAQGIDWTQAAPEDDRDDEP